MSLGIFPFTKPPNTWIRLKIKCLMVSSTTFSNCFSVVKLSKGLRIWKASSLVSKFLFPNTNSLCNCPLAATPKFVCSTPFFLVLWVLMVNMFFCFLWETKICSTAFSASTLKDCQGIIKSFKS